MTAQTKYETWIGCHVILSISLFSLFCRLLADLWRCVTDIGRTREISRRPLKSESTVEILGLVWVVKTSRYDSCQYRTYFYFDITLTLGFSRSNAPSWATGEEFIQKLQLTNPGKIDVTWIYWLPKRKRKSERMDSKKKKYASKKIPVFIVVYRLDGTYVYLCNTFPLSRSCVINMLT